MIEDTIPAWVDGQLTAVDKMQVHRLGLRHKAISGFVMCNGQGLLEQRALAKYHPPGLWANTCCTHPHWDEPMATCAQRRLREELGITGLGLNPVGQVEYRADVGNGLTEHELVDVFVAEAPLSLPMQLNPAEVAATRWVDLPTLIRETGDAPQLFTPWLRIYLTEHATQIFGTDVQ